MEQKMIYCGRKMMMQTTLIGDKEGSGDDSDCYTWIDLCSTLIYLFVPLMRGHVVA
jgi:hypothetical protein